MISGTQTLFNWSLRADTRSVYPHIVRACFTGFMLMAVLAAWASSLSGMAPGLQFFEWICRLNVLLISVSGISYFVSAVTEEKDSGTLALLRLADVTPLAIVLSKSTSRLISALMLLLIQLPFTFLAITLGGVTWQQIIAAYLALAAWMCMVANVALFCSVRCNTSGRAATLATSVLLLFFAAGPILAGVAGLTGVSWISPRFLAVCENLHQQQQQVLITARLSEVFTTSGPVEFLAVQFWHSVAVGGVTFLLSIVFFNRYSEPADDNTHGRSAQVRRFTVGRCWKLPIVWKDFLFFTGGKTFLLTKFFGYSLLVAGVSAFHQLDRPGSAQFLNDDLTWVAFLAVTCLLCVEVLLYASGSLFQEVRQSTIASLTMLPTGTPFLLLQKLGACCLALIPGALWIVILLIYNPSAITRPLSGTAIVSVVFEVLLCAHLTVLLSLYTRWAALPIAIFVTAISFMCCPFITLTIFEFSGRMARLNGISWSIFLGAIVNFVWGWLFVLLPMEIEILNRWNRLSRE
ncbi:MAG: hypothetical protein GY903_24180 [Fuerstiella sp.]|nr:hypothetical protein [Fuerstiella sp.]MCP4857593.1 hypothetical protein [Fuerstiella sp.]